MKKILLGSIALLGLATLASCSSEEDLKVPGGDGVTFTLRVPGTISTRGTFGDGTDAGDRATLDNLEWTVYEVGQDGTLTKVFSDKKPAGTAFTGSQTVENVTIGLAKGKTYQVAFYADNAANGFAKYNEGAVEVDYANAASNTAAEDAFIGKSEVFTVTGAYDETVTLTRPFAQLNWGTDDLGEKAIQKYLETQEAVVKVTSGLFRKMDVISGTVDEAVTDAVEFDAVKFTGLPAHKFPVDKEDADAVPYALIAMNYLLTGDGTIDCSLVFNNGFTPVEVNSAPVKVNYRTNIFGSLLTAPGHFNIIVDNEFIDPDNNINADVFVTSQRSLDEALIEGAEVIRLNPGSYVFNNGMQTADNVTILGMDKENTKLNMTAGSVYFDGKSVTLEKLTYNVPTGLTYNEFAFAWLHRLNEINIKDCIINGSLRLNVNDGGVANIEDCQFNVEAISGFDGYGLFYYGNTGSTVNVRRCEFNTMGKAIVMYNESAKVFNMNVSDCNFVSNNVQDKCAIQMHTEWGISGKLNITNCTATGFMDKNGGLWNEVNNSVNPNVDTDKFEITVDGVRVH